MVRLLPILGIAVLGLLLVAWNARRFIGAEARIRTKDLTFLPSPAIGRALTMGHPTTAAKLRWIDSFAYFQRVLDTKSDTVTATGESAFDRLYTLLTALDPHYRPYYEHAVLNLGGLMDHRGAVLRLLQLGLLEQPEDDQLWRLLMVELYTYYHYEERQPAAFDALLNAWHDAVPTPGQKQQVWDWKAGFGRRREPGLDQVPYWLLQLEGATPGPRRDFILDTVREQIGRYGETTLTRVAAAVPGVPVLRLEDLADGRRIAAVWPRGVPTLAPVVHGPGGWRVIPDPYGLPYVLGAEGTVHSRGVARFRFRNHIAAANGRLVQQAVADGRWPTTMDEVRGMGIALPPPPDGGQWLLDGQLLRVVWPPAPHPAWTPATPGHG